MARKETPGRLSETDTHTRGDEGARALWAGRARGEAVCCTPKRCARDDKATTADSISALSSQHQHVGAGQAVEQMGGAELLVLRHVLVRFMTKGQLRFAAARGSVGGTVTRCSWY
jgi:hypothetical protein